MQVDHGKDKAFDILNEVEKDGQSIGVIGFLNLSIGSNFGCLKEYAFVSNSDFKLLLPNFIRLGPFLITALHDSAGLDNSFHFIDDCLRNVDYA